MGHTTSIPTPSYGFYMNGNWITHGREAVVASPFDHSVVAVVNEATSDDVETAIQSAVQAFLVTRNMTSYQRVSILRKIAEGIRGRREEFARNICHEAGKPIKTARIEVDRGIYTFEVAAEEASRIYGEYIPLDTLEATTGRWGLCRRFPLGPVFAITPFNFPLNLVAHKVAPAIAAGCPLILKPAPQTPTTALMLAEIVHDAGLPEGALAVMPLSNNDAALLVADDRIKLLTFTGSAAVGWGLKSTAGKKRVTLELGGNAGVIVHRDADLAYAAQRCVVGGFSYGGQTCISVQRILVEHSVFDRFVKLLLDGVHKLKSGDPMHEDTDIPPLIREQDAVRATQWIDEAVQGGAKLLTGGKRKGAFVEPAVLTGTTPEMRVNCAEIFAPVVTVESYDEFREALHQVNNTNYGLQAGVFTRDAMLIQTAFSELEVGSVIAGDVPSFRVDQMPYGGIKDSGLGREGLRYSVEDMTERKLLVMALH
ncbi:MAG TPA: aldehyde dehydrogenase family protein [Candidatus Eisenbacteria bacterium]|nr:aldehyde dehydrogenase family protein [Candidatus Eisenbacteria bacterium]